MVSALIVIGMIITMLVLLGGVAMGLTYRTYGPQYGVGVWLIIMTLIVLLLFFGGRYHYYDSNGIGVPNVTIFTTGY